MTDADRDACLDVLAQRLQESVEHGVRLQAQVDMLAAHLNNLEALLATVTPRVALDSPAPTVPRRPILVGELSLRARSAA